MVRGRWLFSYPVTYSHTCICVLRKLYISMLIVYNICIHSPLQINQHVYQGWRRPFIRGKAKVGSEHYSVECMDDVSLIDVNITLPFHLLLSFLHNRIPCRHSAWAPDNLEPLDMPFLSIVA